MEIITPTFEILEIPLSIASDGGNDSFTLKNLPNAYRIIGGCVTIGDAGGLLDITDRRDMFLISIKWGGKIDASNETFEALALDRILSDEKFQPFELTTDSQTEFTATHTAIDTVILDEPFVVRISLHAIPL